MAQYNDYAGAYCPTCGAPCAANQRFCGRCGAAFQQDDDVQADRIAAGRSSDIPASDFGSVEPDAAVHLSEGPGFAPQRAPAAPPTSLRAPRRGLRLALGWLGLVVVLSVAAMMSYAFISGIAAGRGAASFSGTQMVELQQRYGSALAAAGSDPASRAQIVSPAPGSVTRDPPSFKGKTVRLQGAIVDSADMDGSARLLALSSGGDVVPVYYLGGAKTPKGQEVVVFGEVAPKGGVRADDVTPAGDSVGFAAFIADPWQAALSLVWMTAAACALLLLACAILLGRKWGYVRGLKRAAGIAVSAILAVGLIGLSGCEVNVHTIVNDDGSGVLTVKMVGPDQLASTADLPNANAYLRDLEHRMIGSGTQMQQAGQTFTLRRTFASPAQLSNVRGADAPGFTSIRIERSGGQTRYIFTARVDTRPLYPQASAIATDGSGAGISSTDSQQLVDELDKTQMKYTLDLPGTVSFSNGSAQGSSVSWAIPMNQAIDLRAESVVGLRPDAPYATSFAIWICGIAAVVVATLFIVVFAIAWYPRVRPGKTR
jgi:hypothetical protein